MGARVYLPTLGRFLSVDPVEGAGDSAYSYVNDPVNETDLDGKIAPLVAFALWQLGRIAVQQTVKIAVKYAAKQAAQQVAKKAAVLATKKIAQKAAPKIIPRISSATNKTMQQLGKAKEYIKSIRVNVKVDRADHYFRNVFNSKDKIWSKHIQINIYRAGVNGSTKSIRIPFGPAYKLKYGKGGIRWY